MSIARHWLRKSRLCVAGALIFAATPVWATSAPPVPGAVQAIGQSHIPMIMVSSGTMGNNGALTLTTALPTTFGKAYIYLPANAIASGSAAGWYYAVFSSTTVATVYNNTYTSGTPAPPSPPTPFVTTGPGAYTQTTGAAITAYSLTIPGGKIGPNGTVRITKATFYNNSAGAKTQTDRFDGNLFSSSAPTTTTNYGTVTGFANLGVTNAQGQLLSANGATGATTGGAFMAVDTTVDKNYTLTFQLATATDYVMLVSLEVELIPGVN